MNKKIISVCLFLTFTLGQVSFLSGETKMKPENEIKLHELFAYYFTQEGNYQKAIDEYKKILALDDKNEKIRYNLAVVFTKINYFEEAAGEFTKVVSLNGNLKADALYNLSILYMKYLNNNQKAEEYLSEYNKIRP